MADDRRDRIKRVASRKRPAFDNAGPVIAALACENRARALGELITNAQPGDRFFVHTTACPHTTDGRRACKCVPTTLVIGATA